jgi:hypothetical protein
LPSRSRQSRSPKASRREPRWLLKCRCSQTPHSLFQKNLSFAGTDMAGSMEMADPRCYIYMTDSFTVHTMYLPRSYTRSDASPLNAYVGSFLKTCSIAHTRLNFTLQVLLTGPSSRTACFSEPRQLGLASSLSPRRKWSQSQCGFASQLRAADMTNDGSYLLPAPDNNMGLETI